MRYTFWHSGVLIGESDLEDISEKPGQRGGIFHPTPYGLEIFPRLSGILSVGHALRLHLDANGLSPDEMDRDQVIELLDKTPEGQKLIDIGRVLSEVEMRAPDGTSLAFASIGFSDLLELQQLARELGAVSDDDSTETPLDASRYMVSATLQDDSSITDAEPKAPPFGRRHPSQHN